MYIPKQFTNSESSKVRKLIEQNSFVTVLSYSQNERPFINHLPVIFSALPDDLLDESALTSAIVSFKFYMEKTEAKFKLSQNRTAEDQRGIIDGLLKRTDDMSQLVRTMMLESEGEK